MSTTQMECSVPEWKEEQRDPRTRDGEGGRYVILYESMFSRARRRHFRVEYVEAS